MHLHTLMAERDRRVEMFLNGTSRVLTCALFLYLGTKIAAYGYTCCEHIVFGLCDCAQTRGELQGLLAFTIGQLCVVLSIFASQKLMDRILGTKLDLIRFLDGRT
ncbi:hypothetical protein GF380_05200 [Candidatus Uhrbacteria bacterium]|nr:hypothetical protein [Candidatus Uhrbacteria bacterium]MBD3284428.1 hypothetical protein [Candidatus Uhrbacteria bacterium]